jgi:hypothetical protein
MKNRLLLFSVAFSLITISLLPGFQNAFGQTNQSPDPGWPREHDRDGARLIVYQPQVDEWTNFQNLTWRMAISITPKGAKNPVLGVLDMKGETIVDNDTKMVVLNHPEITGTHFPSTDAATADKLTALAKTFIPPSLTVSLHRVIASVPKQTSTKGVELKSDPPQIFVAFRPSVLVTVNGEPVLSEVPQTNLKFIVNSEWPIFFSQENSAYYLPVGQQWMTATKLDGPWSVTKKLPAQMPKVAQAKEWSDLKKIIPAPTTSGGVTPTVLYCDKPADIILFNGQPTYANIPQTQLSYATNTDSVIFLYTPTQQFYYLTAGRWFTANDLQGPWTFATPSLPPDFAKIPASSPASAILSSVPGTEASKDALLLAQVPTTMTIDPTKAAANVKVEYSGDPRFEPIQGTSMSYATNTQDKVIKVGDVYYLCLQGVWFMSPSSQGPWTTAKSVPQEIYSIPPSSPVYNVTYVTQDTNTDGTVTSNYTAGYLGAFVLGTATGAILANGSGYYYPPYCSATYGYAGYYPYASTYGGYYATPHYNSATGAYGWSQTASGPYGSATRAAGYNPYTGTYARGASVSTPYGSRSAAQAYNPYTGTYAQTRQGSSPTAQWGSSYVSNGNKSATTGHYSTANGTVAGASTSQGGKAMASSTAWGNTAAAKTASGNMYAGHDGNVYKNTGSGWEKYDNGSWNSMSKSTPNWSQAESGEQRSAAENANHENESHPESAERSEGAERSGGGGESGSASQRQDLDRESENRSRGAQESHQFSNFQRGGGDRFGGGGGFGGRGGGGGGRR